MVSCRYIVILIALIFYEMICLAPRIIERVRHLLNRCEKMCTSDLSAQSIDDRTGGKGIISE